MRKFFFLIIIAGAIAAFGYPSYMYNFTGSEIGTYPVFRRGAGFAPADVVLSQSQTPVRVFVDMLPLQGYYPDQSRTMLTLTASIDGKTVMTSKLNYVASSEETRNLQTAEKIFRDRAGDLTITEPGQYRFVVGEGDVEGLSIKSVNLVLRANALETDWRAQPIGFALIGLGILGLIRSMRRSAEPEAVVADTPPAPPAKPKWGRDAADE